MNKQVKAIRAEIERRIKQSHCREFVDEMLEGPNGNDGFLSFLDTLEEPVSEDLKEEVRQYYSNNCTWDALKQPMLSIITRCARHFAEWQKKQDEKTIELAEDHAYFAGGVNEKAKMMEGAVAVEVVGEKRDLRLIDSTQRCLFDAKRGDWLKIIIVKEDEK